MEIYASLDADLEVQRTIKSAVLTAFLCLFRGTIGSTTAHVEVERVKAHRSKQEKLKTDSLSALSRKVTSWTRRMQLTSTARSGVRLQARIFA